MTARISTSLVFLAEYYSALWIFDVHLFIHSDFDGHLGYFHLSASVKCAMSMCLLSPHLQFFGVYT